FVSDVPAPADKLTFLGNLDPLRNKLIKPNVSGIVMKLPTHDFKFAKSIVKDCSTRDRKQLMLCERQPVGGRKRLIRITPKIPSEKLLHSLNADHVVNWTTLAFLWESDTNLVRRTKIGRVASEAVRQIIFQRFGNRVLAVVLWREE